MMQASLADQINSDMQELRNPSDLIFRATPTPFLVLAPDSPRFTILEANDAYLAATMRRREELIGRSAFDAFPNNPQNSATGAPQLRVSLERVLATKQSDQLVAQRYDIPLPDGRFEERWWDSTNTAVLDEAGEVVAILHHARDVTEQQRIRARLREQTERVEMALDAGAIVGIWEWDIPANLVRGEERFAEAFGVDAGPWRGGISLNEAMEPVHPDDSAHVLQGVTEAMNQGGAFRVQYRVRRDGTYHWVEAAGRIEFAPDGSPLRATGVLLDIEHRRGIEAERDRALHLLQTFTDAVPGVVYAKDAEGRFLVANRGTSEVLGKTPDEYIGRTLAEVMGDKPLAEVIMANDCKVMASGQVKQIEERMRLPDGRGVHWLSTKAPMRDDAGQVIGLVGSSIDITDRKHAEESRDLLMREVDHRSRNALAVIQSVVRLTDASDPAAFRQAVIGRVDAMARAQSSLAKGNWRGALIGDVVAGELDGAAPEKIDTGGPRIALRPDQVQPLSMILHELATNATKYGALSAPDGRIAVRWASLPGRGWRFEWVERGGPEARAPDRTGFGSRMIERLAAQLGARTRFNWLPSGLSFELVPADK